MKVETIRFASHNDDEAYFYRTMHRLLEQALRGLSLIWSSPRLVRRNDSLVRFQYPCPAVRIPGERPED